MMKERDVKNTHKSWGPTLLIIILLVWAVFASMEAALYYNEATSSRREIEELSKRLQEAIGAKEGIEAEYARLRNNILLVSVLLDYGNGTVQCHENVALWSQKPTVFLALLSVASVEFKYGTYGIWIESINGVRNSEATGQYWLWYLYQNGTFEIVWKSVDAYVLHDGDIISFNYTKISF
ncbi:DUF4430 domain-containing protein [Candidatus Bathyarchaeota archaeon]|nr:DUF4430 domain-containing protein [Candidatus Bathyarchaeota archaeon]